jgi:hypothetical protein
MDTVICNEKSLSINVECTNTLGFRVIVNHGYSYSIAGLAKLVPDFDGHNKELLIQMEDMHISPSSSKFRALTEVPCLQMMPGSAKPVVVVSLES